MMLGLGHPGSTYACSHCDSAAQLSRKLIPHLLVGQKLRWSHVRNGFQHVLSQSFVNLMSSHLQVQVELDRLPVTAVVGHHWVQ
jgi:hypothetical protein